MRDDLLSHLLPPLPASLGEGEGGCGRRRSGGSAVCSGWILLPDMSRRVYCGSRGAAAQRDDLR